MSNEEKNFIFNLQRFADGDESVALLEQMVSQGGYEYRLKKALKILLLLIKYQGKNLINYQILFMILNLTLNFVMYYAF